MEQGDNKISLGEGIQSTMDIEEIGTAQALTNELIIPIPKFSGEGIITVEEFVAALKRYQPMNSAFNNDHMCWKILQHTSGTVRQYIQMLMNKPMVFGIIKQENGTIGWESITEKLLVRFRTKMSNSAKTRCIQSLGQKKGEPVENFLQRCQDGIFKIMGEWSQDERTHIQDFNTFTKVFFISGLLPHIREFVYKNADDTESMDEVLKTALRCENGSMEMKGTQIVSTIEQILEDEEMAINLINKKKKAKEKEDKTKTPKKKKDLSEIKCFHCQQMGHFRSKCPKLNKEKEKAKESKEKVEAIDTAEEEWSIVECINKMKDLIQRQESGNE